MRILFIGDIVGRSGRAIVYDRLPGLIADWKLDLVLINGENAAGGFGLTPAIAEDLLDLGIDVLTTGNHVYRHRSAYEYLDREERVVRPASYPRANPGRGHAVSEAAGARVGVVRGRVAVGDAVAVGVRGGVGVEVVGPHAHLLASRRAVAVAERSLRWLRRGAERVAGAQRMASAYRDLVRAELRGRSGPTAALGVWEWYRSGPVRVQNNAEGGPIRRLLPVSEQFPATSAASVSSAFRTELQGWLRDAGPELRDETIVSYAQFPNGIEIWAFDDRGITSRWVAVPQTEFDRVARRFGRECADPKSSLAVLKSDGRQLYEWLVAPVESRLSPSHVLAFETDGAISGIPVQALVDGRSEYLGDRFAVVFSPGLDYEGMPRRKTNIRRSDRALAIGAPAIGGEWRSMFPPLPEADAEARAVGVSFRSSTVLTGRQATLRAVLRDLPEAEILHFAGHALAEGRRTGLLLAAGNEPGSSSSHSDEGEGGEVLAASALNPRNLRECRLAVLSACSTAGGEGAALVDPGNLVGAFLLAGVPEVVASRWNVNSAVTTTLMRVFYQRVLDGDSVALALQRAGESVRQSPETAHPFFWASFSAYGRN